MNFDTVVFAIKRRCRRLTVTVAGLVYDNDRCGTGTGKRLSRLGYGPATVPVRSGTIELRDR